MSAYENDVAVRSTTKNKKVSRLST